MDIRPNSTRKSSGKPEPRQQQRSLFVVTSVATFLVALMFIYWPREPEPVSAIIERSAPAEPDADVVFTQDEADDLKLPENLEVAWQDVTEEMKSPSEAWLTTFENHLDIEIRAARRGDRSHLVAVYRGGAPEGVSVLNQLMKNFVEAHAPPGSEDAARKKSVADRAEQQAALDVKDAEDRKNAFFMEHVATDEESPRQELESPKLSPSSTAPPRNPSPLWTELSEKLKKLQVHRADMLTRLHPVHPSVKQLDVQIERIEGSLSEISPSYPTTDTLVEQAGPEEVLAATEEENAVSEPDPMDKYRQLQEEHRLAVEAHERALLVAQQAQQRVDRLAAVDLRVAAWAERSEPSMLILLSLAIVVSMLIGLFVAKAGAILDPTLRTAQEAEEILPVPVIGVLPATEASPSPVEIHPPLWCRSVKLAGQLTVASFLFCFLLLAILDSSFLIQAFKHPLSAFPTAVHRLPELIAG